MSENGSRAEGDRRYDEISQQVRDLCDSSRRYARQRPPHILSVHRENIRLLAWHFEKTTDPTCRERNLKTRMNLLRQLIRHGNKKAVGELLSLGRQLKEMS